MSNLNHSSRFGWWALALRAIDALTAPKADTVTCDRAVEKLAHASWLGATVDRVSSTVRNAWRQSLSNRAASWLAGHVTVLPPAAAFVVAGWTTVVSGATVLVLNAIKPVPVGPLSWVVPAALVGVGVLLMAAAEPFARAHEDRRLRHKVS